MKLLRISRHEIARSGFGGSARALALVLRTEIVDPTIQRAENRGFDIAKALSKRAEAAAKY
jgi:hypothetical protein